MKLYKKKYEIVAWFKYDDDCMNFIDNNQDLVMVTTDGGYAAVKLNNATKG